MIEKGVHYTGEILKEMRKGSIRTVSYMCLVWAEPLEKEWMVPVTPNERSPSQCEGLGMQ